MPDMTLVEPLPQCPTCDQPITGYDYQPELIHTQDLEPMWPGGPAIGVPGTERVTPIEGPDSYRALPCGHAVSRDVLVFHARDGG